MIGLIKMAAVSAALSYGAVTAYNLPVQKLEAAVSGKYQDRIPSSEEAPVRAAASDHGSMVEMAAGPDRSGKGDRLAHPADQMAHLATVETREGLNISVLTRVPQIRVAQR